MAPRQAGRGFSNYAKNHLRGDGNPSPVKDATVCREYSTSIPRVEVVESRNVACTVAPKRPDLSGRLAKKFEMMPF